MNHKSSTTLLCLPQVYVATGIVEDGKAYRGVARGWIAIGDISLGVILSVGGIAAGGLAVARHVKDQATEEETTE